MSLGESYEAFIERMAGACPPPGFVLPDPPDDDEFVYSSETATPEQVAEMSRLLALPVREGFSVRLDDDWPQPRSAPTTPPDDEALEVPDE